MQLLDTRLALHVYCNKNSIIYLKSNIKKGLIDYKYIYWQVLINRLLLDLDYPALELYGTTKSHRYCGAIYNMHNKLKLRLR